MTDLGSIVSTLGGGSGIDMSKLAADLSTAQFQLRRDRLAARSERLEQQISSAGTIRNSLSTLASSLGDRIRSGDLAVTAALANPAVGSAAVAGGTTLRGTYSLEVTALARGQTLASGAFASPAAPVGDGTLNIRFGTVSGAAFAEDPAHAPLSVAVAPDATLADVAKAINAAAGGVSAYVANTASGAQLVIKGPEGAANGFVIEAAEATPGNGLAALAWHPATGPAAQLTASAADAAFTLDGLAMTSPTNKTGEVAPGLSLAFTGINPGAPTAITFSDPGAAVPTLMSDLITALNEVAGQLREATSPTGGDLVGDPGARALKSALARLTTDMVMPNAAATAPRTFADLGLKLERDGSFSFDSARLTATLARDSAGVSAMLTTGLFGVYGTIDKLARATARSSDPGSLAGSIARYQKLSKTATDEAAKLADKQETLRQQFVQRFAGADSRIAASQSTLTFLKAQIDAWNASRN